ncbi:MAG: hypothetical protein JNM00_12025, partial [Flavobacteriales bacterium]|nr:hypothetical protein [Flavobacteriales bacterium]
LCLILTVTGLSAQKRLFNPSFTRGGVQYSLAVIPLRSDNELRSDSAASAIFVAAFDPNVILSTHDIRWALYKDQLANSYASRVMGAVYANDELNSFPSMSDILTEYEQSHLWETIGSPDFALFPAKCTYHGSQLKDQYYCQISFEVRLYHMETMEMVMVWRDDVGAAGKTADEAAANAEVKLLKDLSAYLVARL